MPNQKNFIFRLVVVLIYVYIAIASLVLLLTENTLDLRINALGYLILSVVTIYFLFTNL